MRILHVVATAQRRGGEIFASDLTRYLKDRGVDQRVMALRTARVEVDFGVPVATVGSRTHASGVSLGALSAIRPRAKGWRPDVVQAHGGEALKHVVLAGATRRSCVIYRRIGGAPPSLVSSRVRRRVYGELMKRARRVVTVADALRAETIERFGLPGDRVVTIPNGVDPRRLDATASRWEVRAALELGSADKVLLSVGALAREKDPAAHLSAAALVMERDPSVVYVMAGDGPLRSAVESEAARLGLLSRCRFLGRRADVGDLMGASQALLFAGRSDGMEGMPAVLIEAAMAGLPVVAFDVAGVSEVVTDQQTGLLIPWRDIPRLADAALELLQDPARCADLGDAARLAATPFQIETVGARYLDLYESLVA